MVFFFFFRNHLGDCLTDEPADSVYKDIEMMPGSVYDTDTQCRFLFTNSTFCEANPDKMCEKLFCKVTPTSCRSNGEPPADGTKCGENMWCNKLKCVPIGKRMNSIAGGWGEWSEWSLCSRTCGGGISFSERDCDNPHPENGGLYCIGERKRIKFCNTKPCKIGAISFRAQQCAEFDKKPRNGKFHKWKSYFPPEKQAENSCVLHCINEENVFAKLSPRVADGTSCKPGTNNRCIAGTCEVINIQFKRKY